MEYAGDHSTASLPAHMRTTSYTRSGSSHGGQRRSEEALFNFYFGRKVTRTSEKPSLRLKVTLTSEFIILLFRAGFKVLRDKYIRRIPRKFSSLVIGPREKRNSPRTKEAQREELAERPSLRADNRCP